MPDAERLKRYSVQVFPLQNVNCQMPDWNHYLQRILELMKRYPGLIAAFGFCSGVGSFILVDRQQGMARWIAVILLVSWVWLMLENTFTRLFSRVFKREIPEPLLRYATQMIHQESFFFRPAIFLYHHHLEQWPTGLYRTSGRVRTDRHH